MIELMIVITIIAILAAIAIPNFVRSRLTANETEAIAALRIIAGGQDQFKQPNQLDADGDGIGEYTTLNGLYVTLPRVIADAALGDADNDGVGELNGYFVSMDLTGNTELEFFAYALPRIYQTTGNRTFYVDESAQVRSTDNGGVAPATKAVGQSWPIAR